MHHLEQGFAVGFRKRHFLIVFVTQVGTLDTMLPMASTQVVSIAAGMFSLEAVLPALIALRDYERQKKLGVDPVFDPDALGIRNADFWRRPGGGNP